MTQSSSPQSRRRRLVYGLTERDLRAWLHRLCGARLGRQAGTAAYRRLLRDHPDDYRLWLDTLRNQLAHDQVLEQLLLSHCSQTFDRLLASLLSSDAGPSAQAPACGPDPRTPLA